MNISKLAKQLAQSGDRDVIATIQSLLFVMKKFGKSLNTPSVLESLSTNYPEVMSLYTILWKSRCSVNQCQQLLVSVASAMDYNHLEVMSLDTISFDLLSGDTVEYATSPIIGLSVQGKGKVYRRNLVWDLNKMVR